MLASVNAPSLQQACPQRVKSKVTLRNPSSPTRSITRDMSDFKESFSIDGSVTAVVLSIPSSLPDSHRSCLLNSSKSSLTDLTRTLSTNSSIPSSQKHPTPSTLSPRTFPKQKKRQKSSFWSFLSVKEPSTQAWIDYQETIRKQQAGDGKKVRCVGMPMVSSAQLPSSVPKVNSRWDGIPKAVKMRERSSQHHLGDVKSSASSTLTDISLERSSARKSGGSLGFWSRQSSVTGTDSGLLSSYSYHNASTSSGIVDAPSTHDLSQSSWSLPELTPHTSADTLVMPELFDAGNLMSTPSSSVCCISPPHTPSEASPVTPSHSLSKSMSPYMNPALTNFTHSDRDYRSNVSGYDIKTTVLTVSLREKGK